MVTVAFTVAVTVTVTVMVIYYGSQYGRPFRLCFAGVCLQLQPKLTKADVKDPKIA